MKTKTITNFIDLKSQQKLILPEINQALNKVLMHGQYIIGPEVLELEQKLANFCNTKYAVSCANGTDALVLVLMTQNLSHKDAIFVPSFTYTATAEAVAFTGAQPIFVDVCTDSFNLDPENLQNAIAIAKKNGLNPKGIIPVDLFGQPADYDPLLNIAQENNLWVLCDAAQSFGASYKNKKIGSLGLATTTSFFPSKPLGCYGDGGCIFTNDEELATKLKSLRFHGQGKNKDETTYLGMNSRLDTIQAAILLEKLKIFSKEIELRQKIADQYNKILENLVEIPFVMKDCQSVWALYTIKLRTHHNREQIQENLKESGIPTRVYYSNPIHTQNPYKKYLASSPNLLNTDYLSQTVLSLPIHPYLDFSVDYADNLKQVFR
ncbi:MAG: DegT/DnrJ/EryC1/StrS family aminotransferase [Rickettsiales bacterium]|nr:DegT/DnrJ/EryC1/StrS family aminotransferase [Rickettsiales bacterium]